MMPIPAYRVSALAPASSAANVSDGSVRAVPLDPRSTSHVTEERTECREQHRIERREMRHRPESSWPVEDGQSMPRQEIASGRQILNRVEREIEAVRHSRDDRNNGEQGREQWER